MKLSVRFLILLAVFLPILIGCASSGGRAVGETPTADTGPVPNESTTGGDAAGTLNLPVDARGKAGHGGEGGH